MVQGRLRQAAAARRRLFPQHLSCTVTLTAKGAGDCTRSPLIATSNCKASSFIPEKVRTIHCPFPGEGQATRHSLAGRPWPWVAGLTASDLYSRSAGAVCGNKNVPLPPACLWRLQTKGPPKSSQRRIVSDAGCFLSLHRPTAAIFINSLSSKQTYSFTTYFLTIWLVFLKTSLTLRPAFSFRTGS